MAVDAEFDAAVSRTLVQLRELRDMTQADVAVGVGIRQQVYARIEKRPGLTSLTTLRKIAKVLEEPVDRILRNARKSYNL